MDSRDPPLRSDVLNADEERSLSLVREIVAGIKARGATADIGSVELALTAAGASREGDVTRFESRTFRLYGARFSVVTGRHPAGGIEVNFDPKPR